MGLGAAVKEMWGRVTGLEADGKRGAPERKTATTPLGLNGLMFPFRSAGLQGTARVWPKPTIANLRRFAETPVARRAINCIKDRIACMDWRIEVKTRPRDGVDKGDQAARAAALRRSLEEPNGTDSFRTLIEQVIEDLLVGGCGAVEMEALDRPTHDDGEAVVMNGAPRSSTSHLSRDEPPQGAEAAPWGPRSAAAKVGHPKWVVRLWPVDGASVQVNAEWDGDPDTPRYAQVTGRLGKEATVPLRDDELMYVRLNPRTHSVFGLGKLEVAFESINHFLQAHRYAGRVASNGVVQYALWMKDRTPEQQERLTRWWQEEIEGSGRVPVLSSDEQPEVLRLAAGTDAELRLGWQEFLLQMIANAFDLPAMMLGTAHDVNRATAQELADEAFQNAIVPLAKLLAEHITRDVIAKKLGWDDLRFVWSDLETRDEMAEVDIQTKLLQAGVLTVDEVRAMRGLGESRK